MLDYSKMNLERILLDAINFNASDVHISSGSVITIRINESLLSLYDNQPPIDNTVMKSIVDEILNYEQMQQLMNYKTVDTSFTILDGHYRVRVHCYMHLNGIGLNCRLVYNKPRSFEELNLPANIFKRWTAMTETSGGLIIISGLVNQGKTTTLSTIVNYINSNFRERIVILEDPIEYLHSNQKSDIIQKEIPTHCSTYEDGIKSVLREDVDTVAVGEIRTMEAMDMAITLAEAGFRTIVTIHSRDAIETIERIINMFPTEFRNKVQTRLYWTLVGVYHQKLLFSESKNKIIPFYEYLTCDDQRVKNDIKRGEVGHIKSIISELSPQTYFKL